MVAFAVLHFVNPHFLYRNGRKSDFGPSCKANAESGNPSMVLFAFANVAIFVHKKLRNI